MRGGGGVGSSPRINLENCGHQPWYGQQAVLGPLLACGVSEQALPISAFSRVQL